MAKPGVAQPPFRADHVGSLLRPPDLLDAFQKWEAGELDEESLRALQDRYVKDAVALQESLGLEGITDGEFRRRSWQRGFIDAVGGFVVKPGPFVFRNDAGVTNPLPALFVERKLRRGKGIVT